MVILLQKHVRGNRQEGDKGETIFQTCKIYKSEANILLYYVTERFKFDE